MRPKVVVMVMIVAVGLLAGIAVLMKVLGGSGADGSAAQELPSEEPSNKPPVVVQVNPAASNAAALGADEARAARIAKDLDDIRENLANGAGNPLSLVALLDKVTNPEQEVRKAAIEAVVQLNDTNAIPGLNTAIQQLEDPRDKAAIMDAVSYLQLPDTKDEMLPPTVQNAQSDRPPKERVRKPRTLTRTNNPAYMAKPRPAMKPYQPKEATP
jgi:hypothetical protein